MYDYFSERCLKTDQCQFYLLVVVERLSLAEMESELVIQVRDVLF